MALGRKPARKDKRSERSKIDATPPWEPRQRAEVKATEGPFDAADEPQDGQVRIDLGALKIPVSDLEMRVDVGEAQEVVSVTVVNDTGQMQLGAFAAPRSEGIWDEVRGEIADSIRAQGGVAADEAGGEWGTELRGTLVTDGVRAPVRFIGVDGPRWLLRAMIVGPAADDAEAGTPFVDVLRAVVVARGSDPLPVREPIPLRLPTDVVEQLGEPGAL